MKEFCIQSQSGLLYIKLTHTNFHVSRYRAKPIGPGMEQLYLLGTWQLCPRGKSAPMSHFDLIKLIQSTTGDVYNEVTDAVVEHKTMRERKGAQPFTTNPTTSPKNSERSTSWTQKVRAKHQSLWPFSKKDTT